jgi:hypothetical protein
MSCFFGHFFSKWGEIEERSMARGGVNFVVPTQKRECERCGLVQVRRIRDSG